MDSETDEDIARARARKQRIAELEQELDHERTRYGHDLDRLVTKAGLSLRQIAEQLDYRSDTSVRRARDRARRASAPHTAT